MASDQTALEPIPQPPTIYLCRDASRMAPEVEKTFMSLYRDKSGASKQDSEEWMSQMKSSHRYLVDVWPRSSLGRVMIILGLTALGTTSS